MNEAASTHFDQGWDLSCVVSLIPGDLAVSRSEYGGRFAVDASLDMVAERETTCTKNGCDAELPRE